MGGVKWLACSELEHAGMCASDVCKVMVVIGMFNVRSFHVFMKKGIDSTT